MIKKIKKIKKLGIFSDFNFDTTLPEFKRYNLFYGWNGSGKTTLTKLFSSLGEGCSKEFEELEYEIEADTGSFKNSDKFDKKIMVFNKDYVENNIEISGSKAKPIFILGAENKVIADQIEQDEISLSELKKKLRDQIETKEKKENEKGRKFTVVAQIIGANTSGSSVRNYRKPNAESAFSLLSDKELLTEEDLSANLLTLKQEERPNITPIDLVSYFGNLKDIVENSEKLCLQEVSSLVVERLKENPDISSWVETGLYIHKDHGSIECEFCGQNLSETRLEELARHFNDEDRVLKESLNNEIGNLRSLHSFIIAYIVVDKANLYLEFQTDYVSRLTTFNKERINFLDKVLKLIETLELKKSKTTEKLILENYFDDKFENSIESINEIIAKHNEKTLNFQVKRDDAQRQLENHYLSEVFDDVKELERDIFNCEEKKNKIINGYDNILGISGLSEQIRENKSVISSEHKACEELNKKIEIFLGRSEIIFEVSLEGGYIIKRNGEIAVNLSEGEKTAIAFVYFVVHLNNQDFNLTDGIVVVDDPISSLDSNSLFQAFSFLKNSVENAKQVFIFTHNFDFLRLLINWFKYIKPRDNCRNFMISNKIVNNERVAEIKKLDQLLEEHESEYHYLCKILLTLECDGTIGSVYNIPNVARKVLDSFLMFRVPNGDNSFDKLKVLVFDEDIKTSIYKFVNDESHITGKGFDPCLVPETQKNVKNLLNMMEVVSPEHFRILKESINV